MSEDLARQRALDAKRLGITTLEHAAEVIAARKQEERKNVSQKMPNMAGVGSALDKLRDGIEARATRFLKRIETTEARGAAVFDRAEAHAGAVDQTIDSVDQYLDQLERATNGAPPLDESPTT